MSVELEEPDDERGLQRKSSLKPPGIFPPDFDASTDLGFTEEELNDYEALVEAGRPCKPAKDRRTGPSPPTPEPDPEKPARRRICIGASILVFSIIPEFNLPCVLLAREKKQRWLGRDNNYVYTDFGGGSQNAEPAERTASREFVEETLGGAVKYFPDDMRNDLAHLKANVEADLQRGNYLARVETPVGRDKCYVTFVKQLHFQPGVTDSFARMENLLYRARYSPKQLTSAERKVAAVHPGLLRRDSGGAGTVTIDRCFLEKKGLDYFSFQSLEYYLMTDTHNLIPSFKCQPYFKTRLKDCLKHLRSRIDETMLGARSQERHTFLPPVSKLTSTSPRRPTARIPQQRTFFQPAQQHGRTDRGSLDCGWQWVQHGRGVPSNKWPRRNDPSAGSADRRESGGGAGGSGGPANSDSARWNRSKRRRREWEPAPAAAWRGPADGGEQGSRWRAHPRRAAGWRGGGPARAGGEGSHFGRGAPGGQQRDRCETRDRLRQHPQGDAQAGQWREGVWAKLDDAGQHGVRARRQAWKRSP